MTNEVVVIDALRTPSGKRNGSLSGWHPADLMSEVLAALVLRNGLDAALVDDVIVGCVSQVGEQTGNIARWAVLAAGWPESVPGTTIDRQCGSSQQALHFAAHTIAAGAADIVVAGGVESMSRVPMGSSRGAGVGVPRGPRVGRRYAAAGGLSSQGIAAEMVAQRWKLSRTELDEYSLSSHQRAAAATEQGRFGDQLLPVAIRGQADDETDQVLDRDEGIRPGTSLEKLAALKPAFLPDGLITAGNSSQITDGASAVLLMSEAKAAELGLTPKARFVSFAVVGVDPILMLTGPIPATQKILQRSGLRLDDLDLIEINEAFAPVVLAWEREIGGGLDRVNVNGGAIALGHALGSSGTRLTATLLEELSLREGRYGLITMCEAGGMANATILERLS